MYQVIDKVKKAIISEHETRQEAWSAWQETWMGQESAYDEENNIHWLDRFTVGRERSMKKHL